MGKRPRITKLNIVDDPFEFKENKSSNKARFINNFLYEYELSFWFDKHYYDRFQFGDNEGPRNGINKEIIEDLIQGSFSHLIYYNLLLEKFRFLNFEKKDNNIRILFQKASTTEQMLNVITEIHFISLNKYEITIITAMCNDSFRVHDGQYAVEVFDDNSSLLKRFTRGNFNEISNCEI